MFHAQVRIIIFFIYRLWQPKRWPGSKLSHFSTYGDPVVDMLPSQWSRGSSWITQIPRDAHERDDWIHLDVSENNGTPKSSILIGFSIINHPFWGTPIFGNTHFILYSTLSCSIQPRMPVNHLYLQIHLGSVAARYLVYPHHHQQQQHKHQHQQQEPTTTITTITPYTTTNHKPEIRRSIFFCWSSLDVLQLPGAPRLLLPHCSAVDFVDALPWEGAAERGWWGIFSLLKSEERFGTPQNPQQSPGYGVPG